MGAYTVTGLLFTTLVIAAALADNQCHLTVLFESHCPDSKSFIHRELVPVFDKLEPYCTMDLVPFGKARSTPDGFSCQHGEKECRGNMIMSCAFQRLAAGRSQLNFASCFMADPDSGGKICAEKNNLQWEEIENCMQSGEGTRHQKAAEQKSYDIRRSRFVPTIVFNNIFNQEDHDNSTRGNFKGIICKYVPAVDFCQTY